MSVMADAGPKPGSWRDAVVTCAPLVPAIALFGVATGILAASKGFSLVEALLMSTLVFAGASQVAVLEAWTSPPSLIGVALIVAAVNSRFFLIGTTLPPLLKGSSTSTSVAGLWFAVDPNWAIVMQRTGHDLSQRTGFVIKSGAFMLILWVAATGLGVLIADQITDLRAFGVDLLILVYFALLLVPAWQRNAVTVVVWLTAILVAISTWTTFGGHAHIVIGALASALVAAVWPVTKDDP